MEALLELVVKPFEQLTEFVEIVLVGSSAAWIRNNTTTSSNVATMGSVMSHVERTGAGRDGGKGRRGATGGGDARGGWPNGHPLIACSHHRCSLLPCLSPPRPISTNAQIFSLPAVKIHCP